MAEGQPHNILDHNPNRFAARFRVLSCRCHRVIHSCYAISTRFFIKTTSRPAASRARVMLNGGKTRALFINLKPRFALHGTGESPLSAAGCTCPPRQRGLSWGMPRGRKFPAFGWTTGETGPLRPRGVSDAERSDAVDGVRHQFSRARPDLGLRGAQLSGVRAGAVLDRLVVRGGGGRRGGDAPRRDDGLAAAADRWRHRADPRDLARDDGHPANSSTGLPTGASPAGHRARASPACCSLPSSTTACRDGSWCIRSPRRCRWCSACGCC